MKIRIYSPGKSKEAWLEAALAEYTKRLKPIVEIEIIIPKDDDQLLQMTKKERMLIALDPHGKEFSSKAFSQFLMDKLVEGGAFVAFVIGGADGLPDGLKKEPLISLSKLTFTHQFARLLLLEQIYRAFEIQKGSNYHK